MQGYNAGADRRGAGLDRPAAAAAHPAGAAADAHGSTPAVLVAFGLALFAASNFMNIYMSRRLSPPTSCCCRTSCAPSARRWSWRRSPPSRPPASNARMPARPPALFNMMRNLGGAIGIAVLQTFVTKREQFHSNMPERIGVAVRRGDAYAHRATDALFPCARHRRSGAGLARSGGGDRPRRPPRRPTSWAMATPFFPAAASLAASAVGAVPLLR